MTTKNYNRIFRRRQNKLRLSSKRNPRKIKKMVKKVIKKTVKILTSLTNLTKKKLKPTFKS